MWSLAIGIMLTRVPNRHAQHAARCCGSHPDWRGGFIDGDGSIHVSKHGTSATPGLAIGLSLTAEGLTALSEFQSLYGGCKYTSFAPTRANPNNRPMCMWSLRGRAVFPALQDLDGTLVIKKQQSRLLLAHRHLFTGVPGPHITDEVRKERLDLQLKLRSIRAEAHMTTVDQYSTLLLLASRGYEQQWAYMAGFCDADAYFGCVPSGRKFRYVVLLSQKNQAFLQAVKDTVLGGKGSNVAVRRNGVCSIQISSETDVRNICRRMRPYSIVKASQLDVILSVPPSATAREALVSMHGNQGMGRSRELAVVKQSPEQSRR